MNDAIDDVLVVGGGDAGLLAALCIRELNPHLSIRIVDDFRAKRPDVGKSTFQAIVDILHNFLRIDEAEFVEEVKPIWKATVHFRDWCDRPPFHFPFDTHRLFRTPPNARLSEYLYYHYDVVHPDPDYLTINGEMAEQSTTPFYFGNNGTLKRYPTFAYHLDTDRFNAYLRKICERRDIELVDDRISKVDLSGDNIDSIHGEENAYAADLYIDSSGFDRVLTGNLDGEFIDFDLPLDAAFNTRLDRPLREVEPTTVIETGEHGWFWQIDTFDYRDVGYVYGSDYVDRSEAKEAFLTKHELSTDVSLGHYDFTSGFYEDAWVGNCIPIGNAGGFIEPLQSTGLTANAKIASILSILLAAHDRRNHPGIRNTFNAQVRVIWQTIYDFVCAHYRYVSPSNNFWADVGDVTGTDHLDAIVEEYDQNGINQGVTSVRHDDIVFKLAHYYYVMRKMGATSKTYEQYPVAVGEDVRDRIDGFFEGVSDEVRNYLTPVEFYRGLSEEERREAITRIRREAQ